MTQYTPRPFDEEAALYDEQFTSNPVALRARGAVWEILASCFKEGDHVLELNCGTGEDALMLGRMGVRVTAIDSSQSMLDIASRKSGLHRLDHLISYRLLRFEELDQLDTTLFDGVLSNFGGLNCTEDLPSVLKSVASVLKPGGGGVFCFLGKSPIWEILSFLGRGEYGKAFRRQPRLTRQAGKANGSIPVRVGSRTVQVRYYGTRELREIMSPWFSVVQTAGLSILSPLPASRSFAVRHPGLTNALLGLDDRIRRLPGLRSLGDHTVIVARRSGR
jgi:2-polyprenyl-3-methyl-5-hydroxy-6-metoxy-1,4-benzoquinol methylase